MGNKKKKPRELRKEVKKSKREYYRLIDQKKAAEKIAAEQEKFRKDEAEQAARQKAQQWEQLQSEWEKKLKQLWGRRQKKLYEEYPDGYLPAIGKDWFWILRPKKTWAREYDFRRKLHGHRYLQRKAPTALVDLISRMEIKVPVPSDAICREVYRQIDQYSGDDRLADMRYDSIEKRLEVLISEFSRYPEAQNTVSALEKMLFVCKWYFMKMQRR